MKPFPQERPITRMSDKGKQEAMKPEAELKSAIYEAWFEDNDLHQEIDDQPLMCFHFAGADRSGRTIHEKLQPGFRGPVRLEMLRFGFADGLS